MTIIPLEPKNDRITLKLKIKKKKKINIKCDESMLTFEVGTAHYYNGIAKCDKSIVKNDVGIV